MEGDVEVIRKVWEAIKGSGMRLAIDANMGWSTRDAIHISHASPNVPFVMEQPSSTNEEMHQVRPLLCHPLHMDESSYDVNTVISPAGSGLVDGFGFKLTR